jgi:hypothetical protein
MAPPPSSLFSEIYPILHFTFLSDFIFQFCTNLKYFSKYLSKLRKIRQIIH